MSRSPFPDRSTMVIGFGDVITTQREGSAPADSNTFVVKAIPAIVTHCTAIQLILRTIVDIIANSQPVICVNG
jgi:hypothetical protein